MGATMAGTLSVRAKEWVTAVVAGVFVGLLAAHAVGPVGAAGDRVSGWAPSDTAKQIVDRAQKGDRLNVVFSPAPNVNETGRLALRQLMQRVRSQELREACEPPASPYVDPVLAKLPGRCLT
ncbi:MAG: hypothetical protein JO084_15775 [Bradyrhizobiaceae bacterium]|nr:hypothetical protein [Bradyrhizobiaceae bacterium]